MAREKQNRATSERNTLALVFLVTFGALTLFSVWLIYQQFAQVFTRDGQCTVQAIQTRQDSIDTDNPTDGARLYAITFTVDLVTTDGQRMRVPGYYMSTNYDASDQGTIDQLKKTYAVGRTLACGYTYLDPSGVQAIFQPEVPAEGFFFPGFFFAVSLVLSIICIVTLRRPPTPEVPFPDEVSGESEIASADAQEV